MLSSKSIILKLLDAMPPMGLPGGSVAKNLSARQEMWVRSLGRKHALQRDMATHSRILAWRIPWSEEPGRLQSLGSQKSQTGLSD